ALEIAKEINSARDMNFTLAFLARTYWFLGDNANALTTIKQAREYDAGFINHAVALWHGCIAWCNGLTDEAQNAFYDALSYADEIIEKFPTQYDAIYIRALACAGLWIITGDMSYHADAIKAYTDGKAISAYAGILLYNRQNLEAVLRCSDKDGSALLAILQ
ncbi:MAG: hypothetical protein KJ043_17675, partial [Anaerolineae bacterium]|nr:hypothetical protein [Anaerolineae bacterium]